MRTGLLLILLGLLGAVRTESPDGWAFKPIAPQPLPTIADPDREWGRNPIDAFVLQKLQANGLRPSPEADRRTLIRRVFLDLTGLPPTLDEVRAFVEDASADAYAKLVERLLASPRYGERWARHWLDVAHYADSHGQDQDRPRPNAWPYRDYVVRAFNDDKPYSRFVSEQIAGDVLYPDDPQAVTATGFLAAGPWDESGIRDIREDSLDRIIARNLDRDDIVSSVMSTFTALTAGCARCHDHKFDPITQEDYYSLQAVFSGIDKAERVYDADPAVAKQRVALTSELARIRKQKGTADASWLTPEIQAEIAAFENRWRNAEGHWKIAQLDSATSRDGAELKLLPDGSVLSGGKRPEKDTYTVSFRTDEPEVTALRLEVLCDDSLPHRGPGRQDNGNLHLTEFRVSIFQREKRNLLVKLKPRTATADFDQAGWGIAKALDDNPSTAWGIHPEVGKPHAGVFEYPKAIGYPGGTGFRIELDQHHGGGHLIGRFRISYTASSDPTLAKLPLPTEITSILTLPTEKRSVAQRAELARFLVERRVERELSSLPPPSKVYCGTNRFNADGSFRPSPEPRPIHILKRGEVTRPQQEVSPGSIEAITALKGRFELKNPKDEGERRVALARWIVDDRNPLTWRAIVNRVWHYHFGKGIVDTPNDFGKMGGSPSHPELLDWLAQDFRDHGGSLKRLHRQIVTSSTYRQAVQHDPVKSAKDQDNRLLWRMNRGKLDAETVRDTVLMLSGRLDETMYGPPVMHFVMKPGIHVTPEADYQKFDVDAPEARRRSIYRYLFRTKPDPLLEALDCPDASMSAPVRGASLGAPQALALWNNQFTLRHAEHLASLAENETDPVRFLSERVFGRVPTETESKSWGEYARKFGLANFSRVLLNSSEFLFVE